MFLRSMGIFSQPPYCDYMDCEKCCAKSTALLSKAALFIEEMQS